ncbi:MAG: LppX_LprAFG lipoprotein [Nocardiopsaceae bacterium]|nr:LppX_LprAFG lipoprotein [Nocardiopsaceae bacterium]
MQSHLGAARATAALAVVVAAGAAGCSSSGGSLGSSSSGSSGSGMSATQELGATLQNTQSVKSFDSTIDMQASGLPTGTSGGSSGGTMTMAGSFSEQRQPNVTMQFNASTLEAAGQNVGPMDEVITPSAIYFKMQAMSSMMSPGKSWMEIPLSSLKSGEGAGLSQLIGQAQTSNPLSQAQLLAGATNVKTVGTSTMDGTKVTELAGSEPVSAALGKLPSSLRSSVGKQIQTLGISEIKFQVWADGQHNIRKMVVNETGGSASMKVTMTINSLNQPVNISVPSSSEVQQIPSSDLNGGGM